MSHSSHICSFLLFFRSLTKIWFQNKRAKIKKSSGQKNPLAMQLMAQGLYNHSTVPLTKEEEELEMRMNGKLWTDKCVRKIWQKPWKKKKKRMWFAAKKLNWQGESTWLNTSHSFYQRYFFIIVSFFLFFFTKKYVLKRMRMHFCNNHLTTCIVNNTSILSRLASEDFKILCNQIRFILIQQNKTKQQKPQQCQRITHDELWNYGITLHLECVCVYVHLEKRINLNIHTTKN